MTEESVDDLPLRAWRAVVRSHARVARALDRELTERAGIPLRGYEVLMRLSRRPGCSMRMSDLAESVLLSPSGVTRLVDQLESRKLVKRTKDPTDARASLATLTTKGETHLRKASRVHERAVRAHFAAHLPDERLMDLANTLERFLEQRRD